MRQTITVEGRFPSLNEFYLMNVYQQHRVKHECDDMVAWAAKAARTVPYTRPVVYRVTWYEANRRRDLDNVAFGKKFIQDGLVKAGILANDTRREIAGFEDRFEYDSKNPRIVIEIWEA